MKWVKDLINEIRKSKKNCAICEVEHIHEIPKASEKAVERQLQEDFDRWWNTWIEPRLAELERRTQKKKRN